MHCREYFPFQLKQAEIDLNIVSAITIERCHSWKQFGTSWICFPFTILIWLWTLIWSLRLWHASKYCGAEKVEQRNKARINSLQKKTNTSTAPLLAAERKVGGNQYSRYRKTKPKRLERPAGYWGCVCTSASIACMYIVFKTKVSEFLGPFQPFHFRCRHQSCVTEQRQLPPVSNSTEATRNLQRLRQRQIACDTLISMFWCSEAVLVYRLHLVKI